MEKLFENFKGSPIIYTLIPELDISDSLILLHEHSNHFSIHVSRPMSLDEFNHTLTEFSKASNSEEGTVCNPNPNPNQ